jgi:hypothetical protein
MEKEIDSIGKLLTDCSVNFIEAENDDEEFGALVMLGALRKRIYPLLDKIREEIENGFN